MSTRQITIEDLSNFDAERWRDWFCDGIARWFSVRINPYDEPTEANASARRARLEAFRPLPISSATDDPVRQLATNLHQLAVNLSPVVSIKSVCANGLGLLLDDLQIARDGVDSISFVLRLAQIVGTRNLGKRIRDLMERPLASGTPEKHALIGVIVNVLRDCETTEEALQTFRTLNAKGWLTAGSSVRLLPKLAEGNLSRLAELLVEFHPMLVETQDSDIVDDLRLSMQRTKQWKASPGRAAKHRSGGYIKALELVRALQPAAGGAPQPTTGGRPSAQGAPPPTQTHLAAQMSHAGTGEIPVNPDHAFMSLDPNTRWAFAENRVRSVGRRFEDVSKGRDARRPGAKPDGLRTMV